MTIYDQDDHAIACNHLLTRGSAMKNGSTFVCSRCHTEVSFQDVTDGYFAVCTKHDEDLWQSETIEIIEDAV